MLQVAVLLRGEVFTGKIPPSLLLEPPDHLLVPPGGALAPHHAEGAEGGGSRP